MNFLNPYSYIGGAIILAGIGGSLYYQGTQIHKWHTKYDADEKTIVLQQAEINQMKNAQKNQTQNTENNVTKVVAVPGPVRTIVQHIHDAPEPANCVTPTLTEEDKNAL